MRWDNKSAALSVRYERGVPLYTAYLCNIQEISATMEYIVRHLSYFLYNICTNKKENNIFLIYKEIPSWAVANVIYEEGLPNIWGNAQIFPHIWGVR
jgi:hypothetical protein